MKKVVIGLSLLVAVCGMAMAEVTYCVSVKCRRCNKVYEVMSITGKSQSDCEQKAKDYVCECNSNYKKAVSAKGYCPKID